MPVFIEVAVQGFETGEILLNHGVDYQGYEFPEAMATGPFWHDSVRASVSWVERNRQSPLTLDAIARNSSASTVRVAPLFTTEFRLWVPIYSCGCCKGGPSQ
jgi:hypothetical protein